MNSCFSANYRLPGAAEKLEINIVGAGATGVELAAELHNTTRIMAGYGLRNLDPDNHIHIRLIEAGPRILPGLSEELSGAVAKVLQKLGVEIRTNERVTEVTPSAVHTVAGHTLPSSLTVWAAGIRAPDFLKDLDGLESDRIGRLVVTETLQTTRDPPSSPLATAPRPLARRPDPATARTGGPPTGQLPGARTHGATRRPHCAAHSSIATTVRWCRWAATTPSAT